MRTVDVSAFVSLGYMKYIVFIVFLLYSNAYAQRKVDVLLVGASHNYGKYPKQDLTGIHRKIKQFQPNAFFGEFLSREDERKVMDYWCKEDNNKRLEILRKNRFVASDQLPGTIDSLKRLVQLQPDNFQLKVDLAHAYYLNQDVSNAHFQYWKVYEHLTLHPNTELQDYVNNILSPDLDRSGRSMKRLETSEYAMVAFPVMKEIGIQDLYPMDCQDYDLNWSASALAFHTKFELFKKDSAAAYWDFLKAVLDKRDLGFGKYFDMEKNSSRVTEWLNTDEVSAILASGDFYFSDLYDVEGFPKEEMLSQIHWWLRRNQVMCENVVNRARHLKAKRVVVIVGANHRKYMQDIFKEMPGVNVKNIAEISN